MICYKILTPKGNKYTEIHEAFRELDRARLGAGIRVGYRGGSDALGGSYFPGWYDGISGVHRLRNALDAIAEHAWEIIHQSSRRVNAVVALGMRDGWIVKYKHGATAVTLTDHYLRPRVFRTHRGAAIVTGRNRTRHGAAQVICGTTEEHARITKIHEEVRASYHAFAV